MHIFLNPLSVQTWQTLLRKRTMFGFYSNVATNCDFSTGKIIFQIGKKRTSYVRFMAQFKELSTSRTFTARGTERWHPEGLAISAVSQLVTDDCDVDATLTLSPKWRFVPNLKKFPPGVPEISRLEGQTTGKILRLSPATAAISRIKTPSPWCGYADKLRDSVLHLKAYLLLGNIKV